jgi:glutamine phosphoribosylpyrophosphate amidotransferase
MCGVIGYEKVGVTDADLDLVRNLFRQTMIRGKHATGVTYFNGKELVTIKEPIPAVEFIKKHDPADWIYSHDMNGAPSLSFIGHIRYSTSDLRYNQPFQGEYENQQIAIAHNGVISQEAVESWDYETETANDSEMILRCLESGEHPLEKFADRSMAVTYIATLTRSETNAPFAMVHGFRNHERPLYYTKDKGLIFASTSDILVRSGVTSEITRTDPFVEYTKGGLSRRWHPMHLGTTMPQDLQP